MSSESDDVSHKPRLISKIKAYLFASLSQAIKRLQGAMKAKITCCMKVDFCCKSENVVILQNDRVRGSSLII